MSSIIPGAFARDTQLSTPYLSWLLSHIEDSSLGRDGKAITGDLRYLGRQNFQRGSVVKEEGDNEDGVPVITEWNPGVLLLRGGAVLMGFPHWGLESAV